MTQRIYDFTYNRAKQNPEDELLSSKRDNEWIHHTAGEVWELSGKLASGLLSIGVEQGNYEPSKQEKIAIISENRPEWIIVDLAVQRIGAVLTPIYPTISPNELGYIFEEAEIEKVFISGENINERFQAVFSLLPKLKHVYSFENINGVLLWKELLQEELPILAEIDQHITADTLATIIYTSGTTGQPKGVMLSHKNIVQNVLGSMPCFSFAKQGSRALSFLPLNHIFERMVMNIYIHAGVSVYFAESMETIGENLKEVKPIVFTCVPRLLEKVYDKIVSKGAALTGVKRNLFFWALKLAKQYDNQNEGSWWYQQQLKLANKLIFSKWREALGGNVKAIVSGASALQERLNRIFSAAGLIVMEGYGLTETSPVISVNRYESSGRKIGTVGKIIENVEVKLGADGEIICKGPNVMMGYYKNRKATEEVLEADGWLHTGDIGTIVEGGFLKITDRKKEIFKTSGGKYVAPQPIENKMRESPFIEQMIVVGEGEKFISALIVPAFGPIKGWLAVKSPLDAQKSAEEIIQLDSVRQLIRSQLDRFNPHFSQVEQIKKFELVAKEWTIDGGELTPSLKIKRKVIEQKNAALINSMYERITPF